MEENSLITSSFILKSGVSITSYDEDQQQTQNSSPANLRVIFSSTIAVSGAYVYGHAVGYSSPAESGIMEDLGLTTAEYSVFGSILTIGAMLGSLLSGRLADLIGRRRGMAVSQLFCISGWLAMTFSKDVKWLDIGRFVVGFGIGLLSFVIPVYVAEITPKHVRGLFTALYPLSMGLGQSLAFLFGSLVNWRILALIGIIPGLIQLPGLFFIPESPRWLAKVGKMKEFEAALRSLRGENVDISQEEAEIMEYTNFVRQMSGGGFLNLFQRKYVQPLIVGVGLIVIQRFGGVYGFIFYASTIFESAGFPSKVGTIAAAIVQVITTILGVILVEYGRRPMLLISTSGACLACFITGLAFLFKDLNYGGELSAILAFVGVLTYLGFLQSGLGGIPWIIMSEIFPINIKGSAGSLVVFVSWVGSWAVSYSFSFLFEWSSVGIFFLYGAICGLGIVFIFKLVPETKGRTLEEIQVSMMNGDR